MTARKECVIKVSKPSGLLTVTELKASQGVSDHRNCRVGDKAQLKYFKIRFLIFSLPCALLYFSLAEPSLAPHFLRLEKVLLCAPKSLCAYPPTDLLAKFWASSQQSTMSVLDVFLLLTPYLTYSRYSINTCPKLK